MTGTLNLPSSLASMDPMSGRLDSMIASMMKITMLTTMEFMLDDTKNCQP